MRASLDTRIVARAEADGVDPGRVRRRVVFQRILRRLGPDPRWVLKGGYLLEVRLSNHARSTKDLDLALVPVAGLDELQELLQEALGRDPDTDFFRFVMRTMTPLPADPAGHGGWRISVDASLAGRTFCGVRVDVVERAEETAGGTELVRLDPPVGGTGLTSVDVVAVDVAQHAAEKFHAMARVYAGGRLSTRVKDLLDIVLMADAGLLPDERLGDRLATVFASRDGTGPPDDVPEPPAAWAEGYEALALGTGTPIQTLGEALDLARTIYRQALP